jgi:predicted RNA-binding Zn ribbon-like protein
MFELNGGHPALDFVNTLDDRFREGGPVELLQTYGDLLEFMRQSGLLSAQRAKLIAASATRGKQARVLRSVRGLREAVAATLYSAVDGAAPAAAQVLALERYFQSASRHRQLQWRRSTKQSGEQPGATWAWGRFEADAELPLWVLAQSSSELMTSNLLGRLRTCGSANCRWLFLDGSKNRTRRWCDMRICGNRMKARRFHARLAAR